MNRAQRRAAAHTARKAARKAGFPQPTEESSILPAVETPNPTPETTETPETAKSASTISDAQLAANRANAKLSTGATSSEGKAKVARNAITHGLTGNQILILTKDAARYDAMVQSYQEQFQPVGPEETHLLQSIIDVRWRLAAIPGYEAALVDLCRTEMLRQMPEMVTNPSSILETQVRFHFENKFRNLHLQENRLVRRREREMKELRELQATRKAADAQSAIASAEAEAKAQAEQAEKQKVEVARAAASQNGFVFTPAQIGEFLASLPPESYETVLKEVFFPDNPAQEVRKAAA
jgi:hypothetical protein